jgi:NADPH:quinone reductase-like Zn-dependent oxidoreductase
MKAAVLQSPGIDGIEIKDLPEPKPAAGEVLVRMRACSLNFRDSVVALGGYGAQQKTSGLILLSDGAGEVVEVGLGVTGYRVGDRVATCFFQDWESGPADALRLSSALAANIDGVACEYRALPARGVMHVPAHLSWCEAATLPCAALTAWNAVLGTTAVGPGETVVTQGTGGVSMFAVQFAVMAGARVIATSSSDAKLSHLAANGALDLVNYKTEPEWGRRVRQLTAGEGADLVVEIGGADTLKQSMMAVRAGGTLALIGVVSGRKAELNLGPVVTSFMRLQGITVGSRDQYATMMKAVAYHGLRPVLDRTFPLADIRASLNYLLSGQHVGKVCIEI